jgi:hypothetical protein
MLGAGFVVENLQPVPSAMAVDTPKSQAKGLIGIGIIPVCRKALPAGYQTPSKVRNAICFGLAKIVRLEKAGFKLSRNGCRIGLFGQLLTTARGSSDVDKLARRVATCFRPFFALAHLAGDSPL